MTDIQLDLGLGAASDDGWGDLTWEPTAPRAHPPVFALILGRMLSSECFRLGPVLVCRSRSQLQRHVVAAEALGGDVVLPIATS